MPAKKNSIEVRTFDVKVLDDVVDKLIKFHRVGRTSKKNVVKIGVVTYPWTRNMSAVIAHKLGVKVEFEGRDRIREFIVFRNLKGEVRTMVLDVLRAVRKDSIPNTLPRQNHAWFRNQIAGLLCDQLKAARLEKARGKNLRGDSRLTDETPEEEIARLTARIDYLKTLEKKAS